MTRDEWLWVAIRIFGIYLLVLAVIALPSVITSLYMLSTSYYNYSTANSSMTDTFSQWSRAARGSQIDLFIRVALQLAIYSAAGVYMLRGGGIIHAMISPRPREQPASPNES